MRTSAFTPPTGPDTAATTDYSAFLLAQLPQQTRNVQSYEIASSQGGIEQLWLKKAGPRNSMSSYRALGALAWLFRLPVLRPIPNLGGQEAIATEVQRLRGLAACGLRVPQVLAAEPDGFLMRHLGEPHTESPSLADEMDRAVPRGSQPVLQLWQQGLAALREVHQAGTCLSQAFARNMVRCPDGVVAFIDFEDDPAAVLPLAHCQTRDALCYAHSSALYLLQSGGMDEARPLWHQWVAGMETEAQHLLANSVERLALSRHLPRDRKWGRDMQRIRAAYELLSAPAGMHSSSDRLL